MVKKSLRAGVAVAALAVLLSGCGMLAKPHIKVGKPSLGSNFTAQEIAWEGCGTGFECAQVQAPLDWDDKDGFKAITLNLKRIPASSKKPLGTIFVNPGGPGGSGTSFVENAAGMFAGLKLKYNIVGWDPRGVAESTAVRCHTDSELDELLYGDPKSEAKPGTQEWLEQQKQENLEFAQDCKKRSGALASNVSTADTVRDLELLRQLVGDKKLNYIGFSYGTAIGTRYAQTFPEHAGKLVLDGALDPKSTTADVVRAQTLGFEQALRNYWQDCVAKGCWKDTTVDGGMQYVSQLLEQVDKNPIRGKDGRWVGTSVLMTAIITPLYSKDNWPYLEDLFKDVATGHGEVALQLADYYNDRENGKYVSNSHDAFSVINCSDYVAPQDLNLQEINESAAKLAAEAPVLGKYQGYSEVGCWGWPQKTKQQEPGSAADAGDILVVGTTGDPATPFQWAEALAALLPTAELITYKGEGHTAYGKSECVTETVNRFFNTAVPVGAVTCTD